MSTWKHQKSSTLALVDEIWQDERRRNVEERNTYNCQSSVNSTDKDADEKAGEVNIVGGKDNEKERNKSAVKRRRVARLRGVPRKLRRRDSHYNDIDNRRSRLKRRRSVSDRKSDHSNKKRANLGDMSANKSTVIEITSDGIARDVVSVERVVASVPDTKAHGSSHIDVVDLVDSSDSGVEGVSHMTKTNEDEDGDVDDNEEDDDDDEDDRGGEKVVSSSAQRLKQQMSNNSTPTVSMVQIRASDPTEVPVPIMVRVPNESEVSASESCSVKEEPTEQVENVVKATRSETVSIIPPPVSTTCIVISSGPDTESEVSDSVDNNVDGVKTEFSSGANVRVHPTGNLMLPNLLSEAEIRMTHLITVELVGIFNSSLNIDNNMINIPSRWSIRRRCLTRDRVLKRTVFCVNAAAPTLDTIDGQTKSNNQLSSVLSLRGASCLNLRAPTSTSQERFTYRKEKVQALISHLEHPYEALLRKTRPLFTSLGQWKSANDKTDEPPKEKVALNEDNLVYNTMLLHPTELNALKLVDLSTSKLNSNVAFELGTHPSSATESSNQLKINDEVNDGAATSLQQSQNSLPSCDISVCSNENKGAAVENKEAAVENKEATVENKEAAVDEVERDTTQGDCVIDGDSRNASIPVSDAHGSEDMNTRDQPKTPEVEDITEPETEAFESHSRSLLSGSRRTHENNIQSYLCVCDESHPPRSNCAVSSLRSGGVEQQGDEEGAEYSAERLSESQDESNADEGDVNNTRTTTSSKSTYRDNSNVRYIIRNCEMQLNDSSDDSRRKPVERQRRSKTSDSASKDTNSNKCSEKGTKTVSPDYSSSNPIPITENQTSASTSQRVHKGKGDGKNASGNVTSIDISSVAQEVEVIADGKNSAPVTKDQNKVVEQHEMASPDISVEREPQNSPTTSTIHQVTQVPQSNDNEKRVPRIKIKIIQNNNENGSGGNAESLFICEGSKNRRGKSKKKHKDREHHSRHRSRTTSREDSEPDPELNTEVSTDENKSESTQQDDVPSETQAAISTESSFEENAEAETQLEDVQVQQLSSDRVSETGDSVNYLPTRPFLNTGQQGSTSIQEDAYRENYQQLMSVAGTFMRNSALRSSDQYNATTVEALDLNTTSEANEQGDIRYYHDENSDTGSMESGDGENTRPTPILKPTDIVVINNFKMTRAEADRLHTSTCNTDRGVCEAQFRYRIEAATCSVLPYAVPFPTLLEDPPDSEEPPRRCPCLQCSENLTVLLTNFRKLTNYRNFRIKNVTEYNQHQTEEDFLMHIETSAIAPTTSESYQHTEANRWTTVNVSPPAASSDTGSSLPLKKRKTFTRLLDDGSDTSNNYPADASPGPDSESGEWTRRMSSSSTRPQHKPPTRPRQKQHRNSKHTGDGNQRALYSTEDARSYDNVAAEENCSNSSCSSASNDNTSPLRYSHEMLSQQHVSALQAIPNRTALIPMEDRTMTMPGPSSMSERMMSMPGPSSMGDPMMARPGPSSMSSMMMSRSSPSPINAILMARPGLIPLPGSSSMTNMMMSPPGDVIMSPPPSSSMNASTMMYRTSPSSLSDAIMSRTGPSSVNATTVISRHGSRSDMILTRPGPSSIIPRHGPSSVTATTMMSRPGPSAVNDPALSGPSPSCINEVMNLRRSPSSINATTVLSRPGLSCINTTSVISRHEFSSRGSSSDNILGRPGTSLMSDPDSRYSRSPMRSTTSPSRPGPSFIRESYLTVPGPGSTDPVTPEPNSVVDEFGFGTSPNSINDSMAVQTLLNMAYSAKNRAAGYRPNAGSTVPSTPETPPSLSPRNAPSPRESERNEEQRDNGHNQNSTERDPRVRKRNRKR